MRIAMPIAKTRPLIVAGALGLAALGLWWTGAGPAPEHAGLVGAAQAQGGPPGGGGGPNTTPVANAGRDQRAALGDTVVLDGTRSEDADGDQVSFAWTVMNAPAGSTAALDDATVIKPRITLDLAGDYIFELVVDDGTATSAVDSVLVSTLNAGPAAEAGRDRKIDLVASPLTTVTLDGRASSDPDGDLLSYSWALVETPAGSGAALDDPASPTPSFVAELDGDYRAELTVSDGQRTSAPDNVVVTTDNVAPVAEAGLDWAILQAVEGLLIVAIEAGGSSDLDGDPLTYQWSLLWGPSGALFSIGDETARRTTFGFNFPGDYAVQLVVSDGTTSSVADTLLVSTVNTLPSADAGPDRAIAAGEVVALDATGSTDRGGDALTFQWSLVQVPAGSTAALDDATRPRPRFTADLAGTYVAQLIVDDGTEESAPDTVVFSTDANLAPVADAGPDQFAQPLNQTIQLDAGGSGDPEGAALSYRWTLLEIPTGGGGSSAALSDPASAMPTFIADKVGFYVAQLVVSDGQVESAPDIVLVSAKGSGGTADVNLRPVAEAGAEQVLAVAGPVQLDGSGTTDATNLVDVTYRWALTHKPAGSTAVLDDPALIAPSFTADLPGLYLAQLIAFDLQLESVPDTVVARINTPPVADAGADQTVQVGALASLDGTGSSDFDHDPLSYAWTLASKPAGSTATLANPTTATPGLTPDVAGAYVVDLVVNDGFADSAPDSVTVTADPATNERPVAEAGPEQGVVVGSVVNLDGTDSLDPEGQPLTYAWSFTAFPAPPPGTPDPVLDDPTSATPSFTASDTGLYILALTVNDGTQDSLHPDTVGIASRTGALNQAPVLQAVGPQSVDLGSTLEFTLLGNDPDGSTPSYFATGLPANATLDGATGAFSFRPDALQVASFTVVFGVSDGLASDSESVVITVNPAPPGGITTLTGQVLDAENTTLAVENATVTIAGVTTTTAADGSFTLAAVPAGRQVISIDGQTATGGTTYGGLRDDVEIFAEALTQIPEPYLLSRIDAASITLVTAGQTTTVTNAALGATLNVLADTAVGDDGNPFAGSLALSDYPTELQLSFLPPLVLPCQLFSVQAVPDEVVTFSQLATITLPNVDGLPDGSEVDIWFQSDLSGGFAIVGTGTVGGTTITTGAIIPSTGIAAAIPPAPIVALAADHNPGNLTPNALAHGNLATSAALPTYRSLGQERGLSFVYNSTAAHAAPILAVKTTIPARGAVPDLFEAFLEVDGVDMTGPIFTDPATPADPAGLPLLPGEALRQALQFDAEGLPTGSYPLRFATTAKYACSKIGADVRERVLVNRQDASPFGAGWTISQLQAITAQDDGRVVLTEGDGTAMVFAPAAAITPTGQVAELGQPLQTVEVNRREDDTVMVVFNELFNETLAADTLVNAISPIQYDQGAINGDGFEDLENVVLPKGVVVTSHFLHFDPVGSTFKRFIGTATFPDDIVGIVALEDDLYASDPVLGSPVTRYPDPTEITVPGSTINARGLEFDINGLDILTIGSDLRTITVDFRTDTAADQIRIVTAGRGEVLVSSAFDTDTEGWSAINNGATQPVHIVDSGNLGEFLQLQDAVGDSNPLARLVAPAKFLGDQSALYNGRFSFDLRRSSNIGAIPDPVDVTLTGAGLTLAIDLPYQPVAGAWRRFGVWLHEGAGWTDVSTGLAPSQAQMQAVLTALDELTIRADFLNGAGTFDKARLDNVALTRIQPADQFVGALEAPAAEFSSLVRNADGTFTRTMKDGTKFLFFADGRLDREIDRNENTIVYDYNLDGTLKSVSDPADPNRVISLDYALGQIQSVTDVASRITRFNLDAAGNLTSVEQPDDSVLRYGYDENNRLIAEATERGFVTEQTYGSAGQWTGSGFPNGASISAQISQSLGLAGLGEGTDGNPAPYVVPNGTAELVDGNGNPYTMRFNEFGSVVEITDPIQRNTVVDRDANDLIIRVDRPNDGELPDGTVPGSVVTELDYDERGNVLVQREAFGTTLQRETRFEYEPIFNRATKIVDPSNTDPAPACGTAGVTCFTYDADGNLERVTAFVDGAAFDSQVSTYRADGLEESRTDANGNPTQFGYDANGNLETIIDAELNASGFVRDAVGRVEDRVEGIATLEERTTSFTYDAMNRVETETDGAGGTTIIRYDATGNAVETEDATGIAITRAYDERGWLTLENNPVQGPVTLSYDANGNLETVTNALNNTVTLFYDPVNRMEKTTDPLLNDRLFAYDAQDNVKTVQDARQVLAGLGATTFVYDPLGQQIRRTDGLGETWTFAYDSRDNLERTVDAKGQTIERVYDESSRLETMTLIEADGVTVEDAVTFTYDALGNRLTATDGDSFLRFTYDALNRVKTAETLTDPGTVQPAVVLTSEYDAVGNRFELRHGPDGVTTDGTWTYSFDGVGRLSELVHPGGDPLTPVGLGYDLAGRLARIDFPNAVVSQVTYDLDGRLERIAHTRGLAELASFHYTTFTDGLVKSITEQAGTRNFTYDDIQQVASGGFAAAPEGYTYDEEGNRRTSHLSTSHQHDSVNRLIQDDTFCYAYDANGNLETKTEKVAGACAGAITTYTWDVRNRLTRIASPNAIMASYRYDALGRRIEKDVNGAISRYVYDDLDIALEYDGGNTLLARFSHGDQIDRPLVMDRDGQSYYYHVDRLGSVRRVTNSLGSAVNIYEYDSFGRFETKIENIANPFTYTSREYDDESGHYYYRARYYDQSAGRFISEDPLGFGAGDPNLYRYVINNPMNLTDPTGEVALIDRLIGETRYLNARASIGIARVGQGVLNIFSRVAFKFQDALKALEKPLQKFIQSDTGKEIREEGAEFLLSFLLDTIGPTPGPNQPGAADVFNQADPNGKRGLWWELGKLFAKILVGG